MFHQVLIALPQKRTRSEFLSQKRKGENGQLGHEVLLIPL